MKCLFTPEASAIWRASSRKRGRGMSEMKLWKLTGLPREDFKKGFATLLDMGLAEKRRENRTGKNSRLIVKIGNIYQCE